jgi:hypothetical protein
VIRAGKTAAALAVVLGSLMLFVLNSLPASASESVRLTETATGSLTTCGEGDMGTVNLQIHDLSTTSAAIKMYGGDPTLWVGILPLACRTAYPDWGFAVFIDLNGVGSSGGVFSDFGMKVDTTACGYYGAAWSDGYGGVTGDQEGAFDSSYTSCANIANSVMNGIQDSAMWGQASTPNAEIGSSNWDPVVSEPCSLSSVTGGTGATSDGTTTYPFVVDSTSTDCVALLFLDDAVTSGLTEVFDTKTVYLNAVLDAESFPNFPLTVHLSPVAGNEVDPDVWAESFSGGLGTWYDYGLASVMWPTATTSTAPCTLIGASFDTGIAGSSVPPPVSDGSTVYNGTMDWSGEAAGFVLLDPDAAATGGTSSYDGKTFYTDQIDVEQNATGKPELFSYTPAVGDTLDVHMWCEDLGVWHDWGLASAAGYVTPITPTPSGSPGGCFSLGAHLATSGMSLTNPVSWVTGGAKDIGFVIEWAFVPCQSSVDGLENEFGVGGTNVCSGTARASMSQLFGCMTGGLVVAPSADVAAIQTASTSGSCGDIGGSSDSLTVAGHTVGPCDLLADTSNTHFSAGASTAMSTVELIETAAVYIFAALGLIFFIRSTLGGAKQ